MSSHLQQAGSAPHQNAARYSPAPARRPQHLLLDQQLPSAHGWAPPRYIPRYPGGGQLIQVVSTWAVVGLEAEQTCPKFNVFVWECY